MSPDPHVLTDPQAHLLAAPERLDYYDRQSTQLPAPVTPLQAWNLIRAHPQPLLKLAFRLRDAASGVPGWACPCADSQCTRLQQTRRSLSEARADVVAYARSLRQTPVTSGSFATLESVRVQVSVRLRHPRGILTFTESVADL